MSSGAAWCAVDDGTCDAEGSSDYSGGALVSTAAANVDCADGVAACKGSAGSTARGAVRGVSASGKPVAVRASTTSTRCTVTVGDCGAQARSEVTTRPGATSGTRVAVATSRGNAHVDCTSVACVGAVATNTAGAMTGDVKPRSSAGTARCTVHGAGGSCSADVDSTASTQSVSTVAAKVDCAGTCGGTANTDTRAVDLVVSPLARGTRSSASCTVAGGSCTSAAGGSATTAKGGSAQGHATAALDCPQGCTGTASSGTSAFVGGKIVNRAVNQAKGTTSTVTCTLQGSACTGEARSVASTTGNAVNMLLGKPQAATSATARPSSVADAKASIECPQGCTGSATSAALGSDNITKKGSTGTTGCTVKGGACKGETHSVSSGGADVAALLPNPRPTVSEAGSDDPGTPRPPASDDTKPVVVPAPVPGPSSFSDSFAVADCPDGCTGGAYSRTTGSHAPALVNAQKGSTGSRGPPSASTSTTRGTCTATDPCRVSTQSSSGAGAGVNYLLQRNNSKPPSAVPATMSQSGVLAECGGPNCTAITVSDAFTSGARDAAKTHSHSSGRCRAETGCGVGSDAVASTTSDTGMKAPAGKGKKPVAIPGVAGMAQTGSSLDCPDGCAGTITGDSISAASPDGGATAAMNAVRNGSKRPAKPSRSDPLGTSRATAGATCQQAWGACQAGVVSGVSASVTPNTGQRFEATSAFSSAGCGSAQRATCPTRAASTSVGTDNPTTIGRPGVGVPVGGAKLNAAAKCATAGACDASTGSFAADHVADGTAACTGAGCRAGTTGRATATPQRGALAQMAKEAAAAAAKADAKKPKKGKAQAEPAWLTCSGVCTPTAPIKGSHGAVAGSSCTATGKQSCEVNGHVGASPQGAEASAGCKGSPSCKYTFAASSRVSDAFRGNGAYGRAACRDGGGTGAGGCATMAIAETNDTQALAGAMCAGSKTAKCTYSFGGRSAQGAKARGGGAKANAHGFESGRFGGGNVLTSAFAKAAPGQAVASASCQAAMGTTCGYAYLARAGQSVKKSGNRASAQSVGWGSGKQGGGGVGVAAQAMAGRGYAAASASCEGTGNCRRSFSAKASASDRYGSNKAWASARGKGKGKQGSGGVMVTAQAQAGPGFANASSSCSGSKNCRYSYRAKASASASHGANWAHAFAKGSGGGRQGSGGVNVTAQAQAGPGWANASASCSGARNCRSSYTAHAEANDRATTKPTWTQSGKAWKAHGEGTCSGGGNGGCGVSAWAKAGPGGGGGATCSGNCANFHQSGSNTYVVTSPSLKVQDAARKRAAGLDAKGKPIAVKDMKPEDSWAQAGYIDSKDNFIPENKPVPRGSRGRGADQGVWRGCRPDHPLHQQVLLRDEDRAAGQLRPEGPRQQGAVRHLQRRGQGRRAARRLHQ